MRLLPHDQNTGGFFVCVLEKVIYGTDAEKSNAGKRAASPSTPEGGREVKKVKAEETEAVPEADEEADEPADAEGEKAAEGAGKKEKKDWSYREDPFSYVDPSSPELQSIL